MFFPLLTSSTFLGYKILKQTCYPNLQARKRGTHWSVIQETLKIPRVTLQELSKGNKVASIDTWRTSYVRYLADGLLPSDPTEAKIVKKNASWYTMVDGHLLRYGFTHPLLTCISNDQCVRVMSKLHEDICGSHIGGRALCLNTIRAGYYWPTIKEDCMKYVKRYEQCQKHADWSHSLPEELHSISSPWPFHT